MNTVLKNIKSIDDIKLGHLPGYFFPKLVELGHLIIEPFSKDSLGNICYYLHLNNRFRKFSGQGNLIDVSDRDLIEAAFNTFEEKDEIILNPGESIIAQTFEKIGLSNWLLAKLENTSALGRVFLNHASHGFAHPGVGFNNPVRIMLELTNLGKKKVKLYAAKAINKKIVGTQVMRMFVEKLPYPAEDHRSIGSVYKLRMDANDKS